jgi:mRNA interferase MazF
VTNGNPVQGDIFWVDFGEPDDPEPSDSRPVVVVQNNSCNRSKINTVIVCALTRNLHRERDPGNVLLEAGDGGIRQPCVVNVSQVFTVNKQDLRNKIGTLGFVRVRQIIDGMRVLLEPRDD